MKTGYANGTLEYKLDMIWNPGIEVGYDTGTLDWKLDMLPEPWNGIS